MIPLSVLFDKPEKSQLRISPQERWLGWLARDSNGVLNIWVRRRDAASRPMQVTFREDRDVCDYFTFSMDDRTILYLAEPTNGSEFYHLYAVDLDDTSFSPRDLIGDPKVTVVMGFAGTFQLWLPPSTPREVFLATGRGSLFWEISRLSIDTCERRVVARNPLASFFGIARFVVGTLVANVLAFVTLGALALPSPRAPTFWFPDRNFNFRGRTEICLERFTLFVHFSVLQGRRWRSIEKLPFKDLNIQLIGSSGGSGTLTMDFDEAGNSVVMHSCLGSDTTALHRYDLVKGGRSLVANSPLSDIISFIRHPRTREMQAVQFDREKPIWCVLDGGISEDIAFLERRFEGLEVSVLPRPLQDQMWVVFVSGDNQPGVYYLYDRAVKMVEEVLRPRPKLSAYVLGSMHPVRVVARDGEPVPCYLSLPPGEALDDRVRGLPMVLYIHGGPNARDHWGFNSVCQLLTSRGMAVLQVNYRASTGFGARWVELGMNGAFCGAMQHDIEDAARWAISNRVADAGRLAILGASFGGYSALFHLTLGSLPLRAGVAICAVSTVGKAGNVSFRGDPIIAKYWKRVYGPAAHDLAAARQASPLFHLDALKAPVLLMHGESDPRVARSQSDQVAEGIKQNRFGGMYVTYADEGHGIKKERNILDMWSRVEQFLCRELQLPPPPVSVVDESSGTLRWARASSA